MPIPEQPKDIFSTSVAPALDGVRDQLQSIGLRPYRVWLLFKMWDSKDAKDEDELPAELIWNELAPSPKVRTFRDYDASMGGLQETGGLTLTHITRALTRHELMGKGTNGEDLNRLHEFYYVVAELGATHGRLYHPANEPTLGTTKQNIRLRPTNEQPIVLPTPDDTDDPTVEFNDS